jgi:branched-chain amino acid transport system ATP-binding protein
MTADSPQLARPGPVFQADEVSFGYGPLTIVEGVSVEVGPGEVVVVLGPNGSGKSTLVKGLIGNLALLSGSVKFNGADISTLPAPRRVRMGMGYVPQIRDVFPPLTVVENLTMGAYALPRRAVRERVDAVLALFPSLKKRQRHRAGTLSGGERKMLAIGRALMTDPNLLILDEPTSSLAPKVVRGVLDEVVSRLAEAQKSVLMVEQRVQMALEVANFAYVMVQGKVRLARPARELREAEDELAGLFFNAATKSVSDPAGSGRQPQRV